MKPILFKRFELELKFHRQRLEFLNKKCEFIQDDKKIKGGLYKFNDIFFRKLHFAYGELLKSKLGIFTKPSYNFLVQYLPGTFLPPHLDRKECQMNLSLSIYGKSLFEINGLEYFLEPGDAILYSGQVEHQKHTYGEYHCSVIFHFVKESD